MTTDQAQTLIDTPVVFMPEATADAVMTAPDPVGALRAQADIADLPKLSNLQHQTNCLRLRVHLLSSVPCDVERVGDIGTNHGYLSGQPVVPASDGSGNQPTPAADVTKDATAVGDNAIDWLDTPPPGYAAYGLWVFDQHDGFLGIRPHGVTCGIPLQLRGMGVSLVIAAVVDASNNNPTCGVFFGATASPPDVDTAQSTTDAATGQVAFATAYSSGSGAPTYAASIKAVTTDPQSQASWMQPYTDVFCRLSVAVPDDSNTLGGINLGPGPQQGPGDGGGN